MTKGTLGDVCIKAGSNIAQKDLIGNTGCYPIFGASGFIQNVDFYQQEEPYIAIVKDGAGIGRTMMLPAKSSVIGTMQYILPKDSQSVDLEYLYYAIANMNLGKYFSGATIPHIYFRDYQNEPINLPDLDEQRMIARIFKHIDELAIKRKEQIEALNELVKSRFIELFGDMYSNSKGWPEAKLESMADVVSGITKGRKTRSEDLTEVPYMAVSNVKDGYIDWTTVKTIEATQQEIEQYRLLPDDVLMTEGGDPDKVGRGSIIKKPLENCIHQNHIFRVRLDESVLLPEFFAEYLQHQRSKRYFLGCAKQTTGIASINMKQLRALPVLVPPLTEQAEFVSFKAETDKSKFVVQQSLRELETLKKSLMQQYFG